VNLRHENHTPDGRQQDRPSANRRATRPDRYRLISMYARDGNLVTGSGSSPARTLRSL
jgi:hypothetical protein